MGRTERRDYPGAWHHVMNQRAAKLDMFTCTDDRLFFLDLLSTLDRRFGVEVHAFVLMGNHFHLLVRSRRAELSKAMHWLGTRYAKYFNRRYRRVGAFFRSRYTSRVVEEERYLAWVPIYIHLNPVTDGFVKLPDAWPWSSYGAIIERTRPHPCLATGQVRGSQSPDEYRELTERYARRTPPEWPEEPDSADDLWEMWSDFTTASEVDVVAGIEQAVANAFGVNEQFLLQPAPNGCLARTVAVSLVSDLTSLTRREVAARYGFTSSNGVSAARRRARTALDDPELLTKLEIHGLSL